MHRGESTRTIVIALSANLVIAAAKLISGLMSSSSALLAEAAHSLADSMNEVLLAVSQHRAAVPSDDLHPLGHGRERFLWAFMAAIASFLIGGCFSVALALRQFSLGGATGDVTAGYIVLAVAFVADGFSWVQSLRQAAREAKERGHSVTTHLIRSSDPIVRAIVVEDTAGLIGIVIAAVGLFVSARAGNGKADAVASLVIGILMAVTAFGLARPLADFLIGRSLPPELLGELRTVVVSASAVEDLLSLQAVYVGPEEVVVAAKVRPSPRLSAEELSRAMDDLDHELRRASPFVGDVYIDVSARHGSTP